MDELHDGAKQKPRLTTKQREGKGICGQGPLLLPYLRFLYFDCSFNPCTRIVALWCGGDPTQPPHLC